MVATEVADKYGAPERIRTSDTRLRKPVLYPAELRAHSVVRANDTANRAVGATENR